MDAKGDNKTIEVNTKTDVLLNLKEFRFKEILGADVSRKAIFLHLENAKTNKPAVLICDKNPFVEADDNISEWLEGAQLKHLVTNDVYGNYEIVLPEKFNDIKTTLIYPATIKHIEKYRRQPLVLVRETRDDFQNITSFYIKETNNINWVYNFLDKRREAERIVFEDEDRHIGFVVAPDLKWNGRDIDNLYLQAIVHRRDLRSVRDLTANELPLLENIRDKCHKMILEKYGLKNSQIEMFFHYQPSYYHLHVHIINIKYEAPGFSATSILLDTVINNIKLLADYYQKSTLLFVRKTNDPLYLKFHEAGRV